MRGAGGRHDQDRCLCLWGQPGLQNTVRQCFLGSCVLDTSALMVPFAQVSRAVGQHLLNHRAFSKSQFCIPSGKVFHFRRPWGNVGNALHLAGRAAEGPRREHPAQRPAWGPSGNGANDHPEKRSFPGDSHCQWTRPRVPSKTVVLKFG